MRFRPPFRRLRLGNRNFRVRWVKLAFERDKEDHVKNQDPLAYFDSSRQEIGFSYGHPPAEQVRVFLHELLHAVEWLTPYVNLRDEEKIVDRISRRLTLILIDNPRCRQYLSDLFSQIGSANQT